MSKKIAPKRRLKIYLQDYRETLKARVNEGLTQEALAKRLGTTGMTVSRWERDEILMSTDTLAAVCEALRPEAVKLFGYGLEPEDFYHHPDKTTANQLLRDQPDDVVETAMKMLRAIRK
jgi:transcriptional regulator with XRE-family HTH domain